MAHSEIANTSPCFNTIYFFKFNISTYAKPIKIIGVHRCFPTLSLML